MLKKIKILLSYAAVVGITLFLSWQIFKTPESSHNVPLHAADSEEHTSVYTCSMHPQIKLSEPGQCPICFMDLIPLKESSGGSQLDRDHIKLSAGARELAKVRTERVQKTPFSLNLRLNGSLKVDESRLQIISSRTDGRLDTLFVNKIGDRIQRGQPLASIYSTELITAREELVQSAADMNLTSARREQLYRMASAKLKNLGLLQQQIDELHANASMGTHLHIPALIEGVIMEKYIHEGQTIKEGQALYLVADLSVLWLLLDAPEKDIAVLKKGQTLIFKTPSYPGKSFSAVIDLIYPAVDAHNRSISVRADVENSEGLLKPDMFADARADIELFEGEAVVQIPESALLFTGEKHLIYVQSYHDAETIYEAREIGIGYRNGQNILITEGLEEGEMIVSQGAFKIDAAMQIQGKMSMMAHRENNSGASWLQNQKTIANPYFGSKMLGCGEITRNYAEGKH